MAKHLAKSLPWKKLMFSALDIDFEVFFIIALLKTNFVTILCNFSLQPLLYFAYSGG